MAKVAALLADNGKASSAKRERGAIAVHPQKAVEGRSEIWIIVNDVCDALTVHRLPCEAPVQHAGVTCWRPLGSLFTAFAADRHCDGGGVGSLVPPICSGVGDTCRPLGRMDIDPDLVGSGL
jgi:hypothetical protein